MMHVSKFLVNPNLSQSFSSSLQNCALWFCFTEKVKVVVLHTQKICTQKMTMIRMVTHGSGSELMVLPKNFHLCCSKTNPGPFFIVC